MLAATGVKVFKVKCKVLTRERSSTGGRVQGPIACTGHQFFSHFFHGIFFTEIIFCAVSKNFMSAGIKFFDIFFHRKNLYCMFSGGGSVVAPCTMFRK